MKNRTKGLLLALFACVTWGTLWVPGKILIEKYSYNPTYLAFLRFLIAGVTLFCLILFKKDRSFFTGFKKNLKVSALMGLAGMFGMGILIFCSLLYTTAINSGILMNSNAIYIVIFSVFIGEKLTKKKVIGVLTGIIGCYFVINNGLTFNLFAQKSIAGDIMAILAAMCWAVYTVIGRVNVRNSDSLHLTTLSFLLGSLMILVPVIALNLWSGKFELIPVILILFLGIVPSALGFYAWVIALKYIEAGTAGILQFLIPIMTAVQAHYILGEEITGYFIAGMLLIFAGVYYASFTKEEK